MPDAYPESQHLSVSMRCMAVLHRDLKDNAPTFGQPSAVHLQAPAYQQSLSACAVNRLHGMSQAR